MFAIFMSDPGLSGIVEQDKKASNEPEEGGKGVGYQ